MTEISGAQQRFMNAVVETTRVVLGLFEELSGQIVQQDPKIPEVQSPSLETARKILHNRIIRANYETRDKSAEELWSFLFSPDHEPYFHQELLPLTTIAGAALEVLKIRSDALEAFYDVGQIGEQTYHSSEESETIARYQGALVTSIAVAAIELTNHIPKRPYSAAHIEGARQKSLSAYAQYLSSNALD